MRTIYFEKDIPKVLLARALRRMWPDVVSSTLSPICFAETPDVPLPALSWVRVRNCFRLARWREAVRTAADRKGGAIKVVLDYRTEGL
jgi:hypothetical protein